MKRLEALEAGFYARVRQPESAKSRWLVDRLGPPPGVDLEVPHRGGYRRPVAVIKNDQPADGLRFVRFVDWQTFYRQLGLLMVCRRPQTPDTVDADDADRPVTFA